MPRTFDAISFANTLHAVRKQRGMSLEKACKQVDLTLAMFHRLETGKNSPSLATYGRLCAWMGKPETEFFTGETLYGGTK